MGSFFLDYGMSQVDENGYKERAIGLLCSRIWRGERSNCKDAQWHYCSALPKGVGNSFHAIESYARTCSSTSTRKSVTSILCSAWAIMWEKPLRSNWWDAKIRL